MTPETYTAEQHRAWLATAAELTAADRFFGEPPLGYRPLFMIVALGKRGLLDPKITPGQQLKILELMSRLADSNHFTSEMIAMIQPARDVECEVVDLVRTLDPPGDKRGTYSFSVLMNERVWNFVCSLNPSMLAAIRWRIESRRMKMEH